MAKIHTHYDNLKVARQAPQEVIRAAYKVLSQKYHPDKNPGDDKAARIMAIINSAYGILSDPVRRREHDEWIAAEEWEIEWLESTRQDDARGRSDLPAQYEPPRVAPSPTLALLRDPRWWAALVLCFGLGCLIGAFVLAQPKPLPLMLGTLTTARADTLRTVAARDGLAGAGRDDPAAAGEARGDPWARARASDGPLVPPDIKALAVTELVVPARAPDCDTELHTLTAPNGEPWPTQSGYLDGFPIGNQGQEVEMLINNGANGSPVLVKVFDLERRSNVRHVYVLARDAITVDKLAAGKYEIRYQNIEVGGSKEACNARRKRAALAEHP